MTVVYKFTSLLVIFLWQPTLLVTQSSEVSLIRDDLLPELLQLQHDYCGDVILCDDARHVEPDYGKIVLSCCVSCSCLPTCRALDICCPNFNDTLTVFNGHRNESGLLSGDAIDIDKEVLDTDDMEDEQNEVKHESNLTKEGRKSIKERLQCVRPQVQREQGVYIDSPAYLMIGDCPDELSDSTLDKQYKAGFANTGFSNMVPVTSQATNMTYVNIHCLKCNEDTDHEIRIQHWRPILTIQSAAYITQFYKDPQDIVTYLLRYEYLNGMKTGNIHFLPPYPELLQRCQLYDISSCNKTGLWDANNKMTEQLCLSGHSMPVIRQVSDKTPLFRNVACLYCNQPNKDFGKLAIKKHASCSGPFSNLGHTPRFNMTLNVPDLNPSVKQENKNVPISNQYIDAATALALMKTSKSCKKGEVAILGVCRKVLCPRDHYNKDGYCVPLYDTLSGINFNVKFEITPSRRIVRANRLEFAKILTSMVNSTLKRTTSLHHRHISVWYLPRSNTNPEEFFLLNMYLSGLGGVNKLDKAIKEIKDFYNVLKSNSTFRQKTGLDITLQIKFGNRVDFVGYKAICFILGGVSLKHLYTNGDNMQEAGPGMIISETNWCYRTVLMRNETKFLVKNVLIINRTFTKLHKDQVERNLLEYYVCLESLNTGTKTNKPVLRTPPTIIDGSTVVDDTPWYSNQTIVIAICIFAMIILTFAFCKVKEKQFEKDLQHYQGAVNHNYTNKWDSFEVKHRATSIINHSIYGPIKHRSNSV